MASPRDVALLRLAAQHLVGPGAGGAADAVRWMTAMQGQDLPGAIASVALRSDGGREGVRGAFAAGSIVRSWPMRGTLHLVPAEDLGWMLELAVPRLATTLSRRRQQLGLTAAVIDAARDLVVAELAGGRRLTRDDLVALWTTRLGVGNPHGYHLLLHLCHERLLCLGPLDGDRQCVVLSREWVPRPRALDRDAALAEWVLRYFRSHGPARVHDFAWWTKLTVADARAGLAAVRPELESVAVDGVEHLMDPATPQRLADAREQADGVLLLPGFDELLLGYGERGAALPAEHADRLVPGGNGVFRPSVVHGGQFVGTWARPTRRGADAPVATPFTTFTAAATVGITDAWTRYPR